MFNAGSFRCLQFLEDRRLITDMSEHTLEELSDKVDQLIRHCEKMKLREQQLLQERTRLIEKNEVARTRVEAMIGHLKTLQQSVG